MLDGKGGIQLWDENPADLVTFKTLKELSKKAQKVTLYQGLFLLPGKLQVFFGYRITDKKTKETVLVTTANPVDLTIAEDENTAEDTGDNTGEDTGDNTGEDTGEDTGDDTGDDTGEDTGDNTGEDTGNNTGETPPLLTTGDYTILGFNDLGMHCLDQEFSIFSLLPPFNVVNAQVIARDSKGQPKLVDDSTIEVHYSAVADPKGSINSTSVSKTDFWTYAADLFGKDLLPGQGLGGFYLPADTQTAQPLSYNSTAQWFTAAGIPITPWDDQMQMNPYPMLRFSAVDKTSGETLASVDVVLPVSQEFDCTSCHTTGQVATTKEPGITEWANDDNATVQAKKNILKLHDYRIGTNLENQTPVLCASCHYSAALDLSGQGVQNKQLGKPNMSAAIHGFHAFMETNSTKMEDTCYKCHPGKDTQCLRGTMRNAGIECRECHGGMKTVAGEYALTKGGSLDGKNDGQARRPWQDLPRCQSCHTGDVLDHLSGDEYVPANDGLRLFQAYKLGDDSASPILATNQRFAENPNTLYRHSTGHGGVACEGCHGSTHAEWAVLEEGANDNVTAKQLQGHTGKLIECGTCHQDGSLSLSLNGPHGLHNVGQEWVNDGKHSGFYEKDRESCPTCHGKNLEGSPLSRVAVDRSFKAEGRTVSLKQGSMVSCDLCHRSPQ